MARLDMAPPPRADPHAINFRGKRLLSLGAGHGIRPRDPNPGKRGIHVFRTFIRLLNITPEYNGRR